MADCAIFVLWDATTGRALMEDRPDLHPGSEHYWVFPGGKVEPEESLEQAMLRKAAEETGVTVLDYTALGGEMWSRPIPGTRSHRAGPDGWRTHAYVVTRWAGVVPRCSLDHNRAPLAWRDPAPLAGPGDGYTCNAEIAAALTGAGDPPERTG